MLSPLPVSAFNVVDDQCIIECQCVMVGGQKTVKDYGKKEEGGLNKSISCVWCCSAALPSVLFQTG